MRGRITTLLVLMFAWPVGFASASEAKAERECKLLCSLLFDSFHFENDFLLDTDKNYTYGTQFGWHDDRASPLFFSPLDWLDRLLRLQHKSGSSRALTLGVTAFAPDNISFSTPQTDDRPYASLVYLSSGRVSNMSENVAVGSLLSIGMMGLPVAGWLQNAIHAGIRSIRGKHKPIDAQGWKTQVGYPFELWPMYRRSYYLRVPTDWTPDFIDMGISGELQAGYYVDASAAFAFKLGRVDKRPDYPFWNMFLDLNPDGAAYQFRGNKSEYYFTAGVRARYVGYNRLMQGAHSVYRLTAAEIKRDVYEFYAGLSLDIFWDLKLLVSYTYRTKEHKKAKGVHHEWMGINISRRFD